MQITITELKTIIKMLGWAEQDRKSLVDAWQGCNDTQSQKVQNDLNDVVEMKNKLNEILKNLTGKEFITIEKQLQNDIIDGKIKNIKIGDIKND